MFCSRRLRYATLAGGLGRAIAPRGLGRVPPRAHLFVHREPIDQPKKNRYAIGFTNVTFPGTETRWRTGYPTGFEQPARFLDVSKPTSRATSSAIDRLAYRLVLPVALGRVSSWAIRLVRLANPQSFEQSCFLYFQLPAIDWIAFHHKSAAWRTERLQESCGWLTRASVNFLHGRDPPALSPTDAYSSWGTIPPPQVPVLPVVDC